MRVYGAGTARHLLTAVGVSEQEVLLVWQPLGIFVLGIVLYSMFVFKFYRFVARKDVIKLRLKQYARGVERLENVVRLVLYLVEYTVLWFLVFTGFLAVLAQGHAVDALLLVSMTIVTAIRITAYYSEELSRDLAKMVPFSLLGVFLVEGSDLSTVTQAFQLLFAIPGEWKLVLYYLGFLILREFMLRGIDLVTGGTATTAEAAAAQEDEA